MPDDATLTEWVADLTELTGMPLVRFRVTFGNGERFPLEDVRLTMSCDHPGITFLPTQEIRLGDIHAGTGSSWPFTLTVMSPFSEDMSVVDS